MVDSVDSPNCPFLAAPGPHVSVFAQEENDRLRQIVENLRREVSALRLTEKGLQDLQSRREEFPRSWGGVFFRKIPSGKLT